MNCDVTDSFSTSDYVVVNNETSKKSKRKKRKNKYRNSSSKINKKYRKKFNKVNLSDSKSFSKFKTPPFIGAFGGSGCRKVMSDWYWSNYKKAIEWQDKNKIAHWKSCALALQEENRYLVQIINSLQPGFSPKVPVTMQDLSIINKVKKNFNAVSSNDIKKKNENSNINKNDEEGNDNELEFEVSEEMIKFFEQSFKHKMDLEKLKQKESQDDADKKISQIQANKLKRCEEMKFLYGEEVSMIIGMETAVQLSFDKYCDTKSPKYWPNIPLRL